MFLFIDSADFFWVWNTKTMGWAAGRFSEAQKDRKELGSSKAVMGNEIALKKSNQGDFSQL